MWRWCSEVEIAVRDASQSLKLLLPLLHDSVGIERIKQCLMALAEDTDADVCYFAGQALQGC